MKRTFSFPIRHPELVEGSAPGRCGVNQRRLILRQAQDDGILNESLSRESQVVRATQKFCVPVFLFSLLIAFVPLSAPAQTTSPDTTTNAAADTAPTQQPSQPTLAPATPQNGAAQQEDIDDIRPPFFFLHSWIWLWLALGVVVLVALFLLLWNWLKNRSVLNPRTAYELTLEKLEKARALLREDNPVPYAVSVSEIIRTYLGQRFQNPSTRRTTEEFLRQMENDSTTPLAAHRDLLRDFLQSCDMVKFARYQPTLAELEQVQERALTFVTATKPAPTPNRQRNGNLSPATS